MAMTPEGQRLLDARLKQKDIAKRAKAARQASPTGKQSSTLTSTGARPTNMNKTPVSANAAATVIKNRAANQMDRLNRIK